MELDPNILKEMISEGEAQLDALRHGATVPIDPAYDARLDALEDRLDQQEAVIRHTLTMLIEWIEDQSAS